MVRPCDVPAQAEGNVMTTAHFTFFDPGGFARAEVVVPPDGTAAEAWVLHWWAFRSACGCRQIEPISRERYLELLRGVKR